MRHPRAAERDRRRGRAAAPQRHRALGLPGIGSPRVRQQADRQQPKGPAAADGLSRCQVHRDHTRRPERRRLPRQGRLVAQADRVLVRGHAGELGGGGT